jgi:hypothetical protein
MMKTYTLIGTKIQAHPSVAIATEVIASAKEEPKMLLRTQDDLGGADLAGKDLVAIWNDLPGAQSVKKFTARKIAIERIWKALQELEPAAEPDKPAKAEQAAQSQPKADDGTQRATAAKTSKKDAVLELLRRADGATLTELMDATGWQAHSVRGFLSGALRKKMGLDPERFERDGGEKAYRIAG